MTWPTHILAGLIIGKITGDFPTAMAGSLLVDMDHIVSYYKNGILFQPREILRASVTEADPWGDQRNFLHSIFSWVAISVFLLMINRELGVVFSIAYFFHLVCDALDGADFYPFFPFRRFAIKGFINYYSKHEIVFDVGLIGVFITLFVF